ncbi:MAG: hypothetical protein RIR07_450 [Bacteroidota bacterium]|jgi:hypothetical protein
MAAPDAKIATTDFAPDAATQLKYESKKKPNTFVLGFRLG